MMIASVEAMRPVTRQRVFSYAFDGWERRLFLIGLALKLIVGTLLASSFLTDLFVPFVESFVSAPLTNPYTTFAGAGQATSFPYPAAMLYALAVPEAVLQLFGVASPFATLFAYRLVLLSADTAIYFSLRRWLTKETVLRLIWFYWFSPVVFYISYIHGQLDVIPIAFLAASLVFLFARHHIFAALLLGVALSAKTSVLLIVPVYLLYYVSHPSTIEATVRFLGVSLLTVLVLNAPFLDSPGFVEMIFQNQEQAKLFSLVIDFGGAEFQVVLAALVGLFVVAARIGIANRNLFVMFIGFFFCVVLLLIPPMFGWYFWIIPFFAFFFALERNSSIWLFLSVQALYLTYFALSPQSDYLEVFQLFTVERPALGPFYTALQERGLNVAMFFDATFTLLQTALFLLCVQIYLRGIQKYRVQKITGRPFLMGVGGNSGVGKSLLTDSIGQLFGNTNTTVLRGDDRHKWQRGHEEWQRYTHLNPAANHLHEETAALRRLKEGGKTWRQTYDHSTGTFTDPVPIVSRRMMILEGLHPFYIGSQRDLFDLRVFIAPEDTLATHWKVCRDKKKRNYNTEQVMSQIEKRQTDVARYVTTQRQFADIVIAPRADRPIEPFGEDSAPFNVDYDLTLSNRIYVEPAIAFLRGIDGIKVTHSYDDVDHQTISLSGNCSAACTETFLSVFAERLREIGIRDAEWPDGLYGVVIFIVMHAIFSEADNGV